MKIAFCIPGKEFTGWFLENWTELIQALNLDIEWKLFRNYHPIVSKTRIEVLRRAQLWEPDYYMWIKTWDAVARHYGYVYFFEDGPIHYFIGDWKPEEEAIVWRCMQPDSAILIKESLKQSGRRDWTFTVIDGLQKTHGKGGSVLVKRE